MRRFNGEAMSFFKNLIFVLTSNLTTLLISMLIVLILPKVIGVVEYGYFQIYIFYSLFAGFFHFGWVDGIYLRYGGFKYDDLNKNLFFSQFYMMFILQLFLLGTIYFLSSYMSDDFNRVFIFRCISIAMLLVNLKYMLAYILQITNRIKEFSFINTIEKVYFIFLVVFIFLTGISDFKLLIFADMLGKLFSLLHAMYYCKDIVFRRFSSLYFSFHEMIKNIVVGIKLLLANITSMLIIGVVRIGIERTWDVRTFGKISLILNISSFMMIFLNAIGVVLYPILKRMNEKTIHNFYPTIRNVLMLFLLATPLLFFPVKYVLTIWLPQYEDVLMYMSILFPIAIYEGKTSLLSNTFLKTLRKEKLMLNVNIITCIIGFLLTCVSTVFMKNLILAICSILILMIFRSTVLDFYLYRFLKISGHKDNLLEILLTFIFILSSYFFISWYAVLVYVDSYILYILLKRKEIKTMTKHFKTMLQQGELNTTN